MKYYQIDFPTDSQKVGIYPQIEYFYASTYNVSKENSFQKLSSRQFLDVIPDLNCFYLANKAKITNILSSTTLDSNVGFFLDQNVYDLLCKINDLSHVKFYSALVDKKYKQYKHLTYRFIHVIINFDILNYEEMSIMNAFTKEKININSKVELKETLFNNNSFTVYRPEKYILKNPSDLLRLPMSIDIYISEKLKSILEENEITGIEFKPTDKVVLG